MSKPDAAVEAAANETTSAEVETGSAVDEGATTGTAGAPASDAATEAAATPPAADVVATTSVAATEAGMTEVAATEAGMIEAGTTEADTTEVGMIEPAVAATDGASSGASSETAVAESAVAQTVAAQTVATESAETAPAGEPSQTPATGATAAESIPVAGTAATIAPTEKATPPSEHEGALAPPSPELEAILAAHEQGERLEGRVIGWNKGGFHVVMNGVPAFCPKSQIEVDNPKRAAAYVDRTFQFRVLEIKDHGKRVVLTRRQVLIEDREAAVERLRQRKAAGEAIEGKVTSITDFGAFVDVGGLEGLVHLSQLSRRRVDNAREVVQVGQDVRVKVLKIEKGGERISLSMKALEPDPWGTVAERFDTGSQFEGTILRKAEFGLFVDVGDGIEGLVHSSNLELGKNMDSLEYAEGQKISGWVREVDPERRRLSLSLREVAQSNPWSDIKSRYTEGNEVNGKVEQVARFGVFVELEPGLTGLLPFSSLPEIQGPRPARQFRPGDPLEVVIDAIDIKRRRISLAPVGSRLEGTKTDYKDYQKKASSGGLGALAAAFEKIQQP